MKRVLVVQLAALGWELWKKHRDSMPNLSGLARSGFSGPLRPVFPALTATAQATVTTGELPSRHGIVANGFFSRPLMKPFFWEQSSRLVEGPKIWQRLKIARPEATSAMLFWQNSIGSENDIILTPAPIHKHGGGIIDVCYCRPAGLYDELASRFGHFKLRWYWGPLTSPKGTRWIARATAHVLRTRRPNLVLTYLPLLDYGLQKRGPQDEGVQNDIGLLDEALGEVLAAARDCEYQVCVFSDYAISPVRSAAFPNRALADNGLFACRIIEGRAYPDFAQSRAFAICDHQIAHIYCRDDPAVIREAREILSTDPRTENVYAGDELIRLGLAHGRCGELVAVARSDAWFAYPWWTASSKAPQYARHIDIHNKPGFDPLEMFFDSWRVWRISGDTRKVRGSHGRVADDGATDAALITSEGIADKAVGASAVGALNSVILSHLVED